MRQVGPDAIIDDKLSEAGFLYLHTIFIQKGRMETTWTILRSFGYGDDLTLKEDFISPRFDVPSDCCVELTPAGYSFLTDLFERYDKVSSFFGILICLIQAIPQGQRRRPVVRGARGTL